MSDGQSLRDLPAANLAIGRRKSKFRSLALQPSLIVLHLLIGSLLVVSGCATRSPSSIPVRSVEDLDNWQASGRIAVSAASEGGSGSFAWEQRGADSSLQIRGPVGIGSVRLTLSGDFLSVDLGGGRRYTAQDAETELADRLGARL